MPKIQDVVRTGFADVNKTNRNAQNKSEGTAKDFGETISDFIKGVNTLQKDAGKEVREVIEGRSENLHQAMAKMEEAKISFQLMLEIRNKLMESYKELQRTQV